MKPFRSTQLFLLGALAFSAVLLVAQAPGKPSPPSTAPRTRVAEAPRKNPIPDTFMNLKVLPEDISKRDLVAIMKAMSIGIKVRCSNCHMANDDLSQADFASDEKPAKIASREMLKILFETRAKYPASATVAPKKK